MSRIRRYIADERGATALEYCFIAGMISIVVLVACQAIGIDLASKFYGPLSNGMH